MGYRFSPRNLFGAVFVIVLVASYALMHLDIVGSLGPWPFIVFGVSLVGAGAYWAWDELADERHLNAMAKFARLNHWEFAPQTIDYRRWFGSYPFGYGMEQRDIGLVRGTFNDRACASFTHEYKVGREDQTKRTERWQITLAELPYPLPTLDILPDDMLAKTEKAFGGMDVDFESAAFNQRWRVKAGNLKYAHDIINPRMMERLLELDAEGLAIRIEGRAVLCWQADFRGPEDLARRLRVVTAVAKRIPSFVLNEFEYIYKKQDEEARKREENAPDWAKTPYALTSGHYTGIGAEDYDAQELTDEETGFKPPTTPRPDDEKRSW